MVVTIPRLTMVLLLLLATACESTSHVDAGAAPLPWFGRTRGSAVVLSRDERVAVVTNRTAGVVTIFGLSPDKPLEELVQRSTEIDMGAGSEPWAAVIGGDDDTAYVISRHEKTVTRIGGLHGTPRLRGSLRVGSEPTAIAIAPSGKRLFIANWGEGTISVISTLYFGQQEGQRDTLDLNEALVRTGVLGAVEPRRGLAHPRALAMTDDGDDDDGDETLYATEFFSMPLLEAGSSTDPGFFDRNRQGFVYPIALARDTRVGDPIPIAPVADTGFADANGAATGCFPNQLYAAAAVNDRLFVTSMCASPEGPLGPAKDNPANFKTVVHPAVFVVDTRTNQELPEQGLLLTRELDARYASDQERSPTGELDAGYVSDQEGPRMPLIPNDIAFTAPAGPGTTEPRTGCITAMGSDAVFCIQYDHDGRLLDIGSSGHRYLDLTPARQVAGHLPVGIAVSRRRAYGLVVSDNTQSLAVVDRNAVRAVHETVRTIPRAADILRSPANDGRQLFATGLGVWSFNGQAWGSCESCHPDGLSDGVTWFFARGPRRTISTAATYYGDGDRRVLLWTGNVDEVHDIEAIVRSVAGGVGALLWKYAGDAPRPTYRIIYDGNPNPEGKPTSTLHNNLNASAKELLAPLMPGDPDCDKSALCDKSLVREWDKVDAFIRSVRSPQRPTLLESAQVGRGAGLFRNGNCAGCHGGPGWTLSRVFFTPGARNNGELPYSRPLAITDEQLGLLRTESYAVPPELRPLNPPGRSGMATFRRWDPPADRDPVVHLYGTKADDGYDSAKTHVNDQINCVLRAVGTFPNQASGENRQGVVPSGSPIAVQEVRAADMMTLALGETGFNVPSLVGVAAGAPYFHAGNARSLEEVFDPAFAAHHQALAPGFLAEGSDHRSGDVRDLTAYLLSIDDDWPSELAGLDLCVLPSGGQFE